MLFSQQVIHRLHRIERAEWYFHEDGVPIAHGTVPKTRQFECFEFLAVLALVGDEACLMIHILREVELIALIVLHSTHEVNRVEMGSILEHLQVFCILCVNLAALKDLQADGAILIVG